MSEKNNVLGKERKVKRAMKNFGTVTVAECACGRQHNVLLFEGFNDVHLVCDCGAVVYVDVVFDGQAVTVVKKWAVEEE